MREYEYEENEMADLCATCGNNYGQHYGPWCPNPARTGPDKTQEFKLLRARDIWNGG